MKNRLANLEHSAALWREEQAESDLSRFEGRISAAGREKWKAALLANRTGTLELLKSLASPAPAPVHQRSRALAPLEGRRDRELAKTIREYQNRNQCRWQQAWDAVREDRPELFGNESGAAGAGIP